MKHCVRTLGKRFTLVALAVSLTVLSTGATASAQGQGEFITQASARLAKQIATANGEGFKLADNTFSIGGGWLKKDTATWVALFTITMEEGKQYRVLASGDNDATDVDVQITDPKGGKVYVSDTSTAADAVVNFTPEKTGRYLVRVRLYASRNNLPCVCLAIVMSK